MSGVPSANQGCGHVVRILTDEHATSSISAGLGKVQAEEKAVPQLGVVESQILTGE